MDHWLDVNAQKWNDSRLTVAIGEPIQMEVRRDGLIVWRTGLLGRDFAPPQGDPRVTPANTPLWVTPPMPDVPIGALIGAILDPKYGSAPPPDAPFLAVFRIQLGGIIAMPANGRLFLGVNDGGFFNNSGCFQVRLTRLRK
jgi:hypothetical protein